MILSHFNYIIKMIMIELNETVNNPTSGTISEKDFLPYRKKYKLSYHLRYGFMALSIVAIFLLVILVIYYNDSDSYNKPMSHDDFIHYVTIFIVASYIFTWVSCIGWKLNNVVTVEIIEQFSSRKDLHELAVRTDKKDNWLIILCGIVNASVYFTVVIAIFFIVGSIFIPFSDLVVDKNADEYVAKEPSNTRKSKKRAVADLTHELDKEVLHPNLVYNHV